MVRKSMVDHKWRKEIRDEFLRAKLQALDQDPSATDVVDGEVEEISTRTVEDEEIYLDECRESGALSDGDHYSSDDGEDLELMSEEF
ncbi:hypothetical protein ANCCAN_17415 [Ancylostoma caninum]|uniref:Uncharacterized protein n=1 Tax=Ancylostoma caninum TaxID=29170 RepID=A0A368G0Z9_ANCCA|nr:hypothetical protein ANCCAN_17415 [Ancylostoma caninum]